MSKKAFAEYIENGVTITVYKAAKPRLAEKLNGGRTARHKGSALSLKLLKDAFYPGANRQWAK